MSALLRNMQIKKASEEMLIVANFILKKIICTILPIFVLGFVVKIQYEGVLFLVMKEYSVLLVVVAFVTYGYMMLLLL